MANDFLQVVGVGDDGQLWHTIRNADGSWTPRFGLIEGESSGGPGKFTDVACGSADGLALQVVGVGDDGQLWHTIRNADGTWTPGFGLIESVSVGGSWKFNMVGCAGTEGGPFIVRVGNPTLQVIGVGSDGQLWYTIRNADGTGRLASSSSKVYHPAGLQPLNSSVALPQAQILSFRKTANSAE